MGVISIDNFKEIQNQANEIQFFFKINDKTTAIRLNENATVLELKNKIQDKSGVPVSLFHCVVGKTPLSKDSASIGTIISKDSTVICNLKLKGGAFIPGQIVLQKDVLDAQKDVSNRLKKRIKAWKRAECAEGIINKACEDSLMYSENSLSFYLNKANKLEGNKELDELFQQVNSLVGGLIELDKTLDKEQRYNSDFYQDKKKVCITSIEYVIDNASLCLKRLGEVHSEKAEEKESSSKEIKDLERDLKICEDLKKILKDCVNEFNDERISIDKILKNAFFVLKGCPYYTLETPELILLKSRDIPVGEVYGHIIIEEDQEGGKDGNGETFRRNLIKLLYKKVYLDMSVLSKQIKNIGLCNNYYLKVLKEQHIAEDKDKIKEIITSLTATTYMYDKNPPLSEYEELSKLGAKEYFEGKFLTALTGFNDNQPEGETGVTFGLVAQAAKNLADFMNVKEHIIKDISPYWIEKAEVVRECICTVNSLRAEFKNRMTFAEGLLNEFGQMDYSSKKVEGLSEIVKIGVFKTKYKNSYDALYSEIYTTILVSVLGWTSKDKSYVINIDVISEKGKFFIDEELKDYLEKREFTYTIDRGVLCKVDIELVDNFVDYASAVLFFQLENKLEAAIQNKNSHFAFLKKDDNMKYVTKGKQDLVGVGVATLNAQVVSIENFCSQYNTEVKKKREKLGIEGEDVTTLEKWARDDYDLNNLKFDQNYKRIKNVKWHGADLLEEANHYYMISDELRVVILHCTKFVKSIDSDVENEEMLESLQKGKHNVMYYNSVITNLVDMGAVGSAILYPPITPTLVLIKQAAKYIALFTDKAIEYCKGKSEEKLKLSLFVSAINSLMQKIIKLQKEINEDLKIIFKYSTAKTTFMKKVKIHEAKK